MSTPTYQDYMKAILAVNVFHSSVLKAISSDMVTTNVLNSSVIEGAFDQVFLLLCSGDSTIESEQLYNSTEYSSSKHLEAVAIANILKAVLEAYSNFPDAPFPSKIGVVGNLLHRLHHLVKGDIANTETENNSSIGSVGELENALAHIKNNNGMVKMAFDTIGNSTFPRVIIWATADQLALAKTGIADVLAMDATYGILSCGMPVVQVFAKTATENLLPLVQAVVFNEQVETYRTLVQHILELVGITRVKTLFTDADSALIKAISEIPDVKHHLCMFHKRMNIRSAAGVVARDKKQASVIEKLVDCGLIQAADGDTDLNVILLDLCVQAFNKVIYMHDITNYNRMKQNLIESFPLSSQSRICSIFNLEEHFIYLHTYTWRTHGWETSSAAESIHSALKHMLRQKSTNKLSFDDFVQQNYEFIEYRFAQVNSNVQLNMSRKIHTLPSQSIRESAGRITRGIAIDVYKSYMASKTEYVAAISEDRLNCWNVHKNSSRNTDTGHIAYDLSMQVTCNIIDGKEIWKCSCFKYKREGCPCVHVMAARHTNNIAKRGGDIAPEDENNIVLLGDFDPRWIFPENTSANIDTDIEDIDSDVSDMESLKEMALSILDDIVDKKVINQISQIKNVLSFSHAMADQEHSTDRLQLPGVSMPQVKIKGRPKNQKIVRDKTIAEKTLEECAQRDAQAKRKAPMPVNPDASTSASAKRSWNCSVCKQPGHNSRRCPNSNNSSE
ncbi:hypothetical protein COEREDRAFT_11421 [Coemansia reversa NRRL 1564]|uniref:SWIM-type domain-containing protein n=1 Tax=Coemansia reversa (strain ATCC 12441 / NRRL 1564) TaxID=763665 RepID=A0A2G5B3B8_COERN|nr:hypothetical protein COEREDRAFT_11421 [Coemansia reversa NRRL 1564]|eukprot:PIA13494.1 hypothetical protein COEREDRAFT_11421 [Coemansia reversa NRRL 1564]